MRTIFNKTILVVTLLSIVMLGCKKKESDPEPEPTPTPTPTENTFKIESIGTFTSGTDDGGKVEQVTDHLQFSFIGKKGDVSGGGNIHFPLNSQTGTYNAVPKSQIDLLANEVAVDMSSSDAPGGGDAQSGTVSLTVTSGKYKIVFTDLPTLDGTATDKISGNFSY